MFKCAVAPQVSHLLYNLQPWIASSGEDLLKQNEEGDVIQRGIKKVTSDILLSFLESLYAIITEIASMLDRQKTEFIC